MWMSRPPGRLGTALIVAFLFSGHLLPSAEQPPEAKAARPTVDESLPESKAAEEIIKHLKRPNGFCVDLACGSGLLGQALVQKTSLYVHALESSDARVTKAREALLRFGDYSRRIHVEKGGTDSLPFPDHFVDLIVRGDLTGKDLDKTPWEEVCRVLAPGGMAFIGKPQSTSGVSFTPKAIAERVKALGVRAEVISANGSWVKLVKTRPTGMGDWSHAVRFTRRMGFAGNINGNAHNRGTVDDDLAKGPFTLAFVCGPASAGGKGNLQAMSSGLFVLRWGGLRGRKKPQRIQAFSGYNGSLLWDKRLETGQGHGLVVVDDFVFLVDGEKMKCLSALNGEVVWQKAPTECNEKMKKWTYYACDAGVFLAGLSASPKGTGIQELVAMSPKDGRPVWRMTPPSPAGGMVVGKNRVFLACSDKSLLAFDLQKGTKIWATPKAGSTHLRYWPVNDWIMSEATAYDGSNGKKVKAGIRKNLIAGKNYISGGLGRIKLKDGHFYYEGRFSATDVATNKGLGSRRSYGDPSHPKMVQPSDYCHGLNYVRCFGLTGSTHCIFTNYKGMVIGNIAALTDPKAKPFFYYDGMCRPDCDTNVIAGNGRVLCPPSGCGCDFNLKQAVALAPMPTKPFYAEVGSGQLEKGEAWGRTVSAKPDPTGWPAFRHDSGHSGVTNAELKPPLKHKWVAKLNGRLTPPIAIDKKVFVGSSDHSIYCVNQGTGEIAWKYTTGGIIKRSPTWWKGRVYAGSLDGHVYCLRADNGKLIWRFRGAPNHRYMLFRGSPRSVWPVSGGVVVDDGVVNFYAGLATGDRVFTYALKAETGEIIWGHDKAGRAVEFMPTKEQDGHTVALTGASPFGMTPWGTVAASADTLFVPQGMRPPGGIDRKTGKIKWFAYRGDSQQRSSYHLQWKPTIWTSAGGTTVVLAGNEHIFAGGFNDLAKRNQQYKVYLQKNGRQLHQDHPSLFKQKTRQFRDPKEGPSYGKAIGAAWGHRSLSAGGTAGAPVLDTSASDKYPEGLLYRTDLGGIHDFAGFKNAQIGKASLTKTKVAGLVKGSVIVTARHYVVAGGKQSYAVYDKQSFQKAQTLQSPADTGDCVVDGAAFSGSNLIASTKKGCVVCFGP